MRNFDSHPPVLDVANFPEEDTRSATHINQLLVMLNYYVRCFEADVQLYEFSAEQIAQARTAFEKDPSDKMADEGLEILDGWPVVAARDGAMSIYHFGRTLDGLDETLAKAPNLAAKVDLALRKSARRTFKSAFRDFIGARHAVAHSGDKARTETQQGQHALMRSWANEQVSFRGPGDVVLIDVLNQRQYSNTWEGRVVSYKISIDSLRKLAEVRDEIYRAFSSLATSAFQPNPLPSATA